MNSSPRLEDHLEQIARMEPRVSALVGWDEARARRNLERASPGPLSGWALGVKDIIDVAGLPTLAGSTLPDSRPAVSDSPIVTQLREAGAIILGKTVTTEFACFDPSPTRNPWNHHHTPGGSSSGSAAAVAVGMCLAAIGTQTGGSIIRPAAYCGVCGLKPTFGRLNMSGIVPVSTSLDHVGPIAGSVADLLVLFAVLADEVPVVGGQDKPLRIGVIESVLEETPCQETVALVRQAISSLGDAGALVSKCALPTGFAELREYHWRIMAREAADYHRRWFPEHRNAYGARIAAMLDEGLAITDEAYQEARSHQRQLSAEIDRAAGNIDLLLTPATPTPSLADLDTTGDPRFNSPWSYVGLPVVTFPIGLSASGMPIGVQWIGRRGEDQRLLSAACWGEQIAAFDHQV